MEETRKADAAALPQSLGDTFLDQLLRRSPLIIAVRDPGGRVVRVSRRLERMFRAIGLDPVGASVYDLLPTKFAERLDANDRRALAAGLCVESEEQLFLGGIHRAWMVSRIPLLDAAGRVDALLSIAVDITARKRNEEALRNAALAVSSAHRGELLDQLVRYLATTLGVDCAFIATVDASSPDVATIVAGTLHGGRLGDITYSLAGTPCESVVGRRFEFIPRDLTSRYPDAVGPGPGTFESYAAHPLFDSERRSLGVIVIAHGEPLTNRRVIESMLRIFSVRAAAELERRRAERELAESEANYREIFENAEDAIFVHDFDTSAIVDVNPKACEAYGYTRDEFLVLDPGRLSSGVPPYTLQGALAMIERAKRGEKVRVEWHRRNKDGSLHWDEVVIHRTTLAGRPRILVFTREITERRQAEQALKASQVHYKAIFDASVDAVTLWDERGRLVDVNPAFCRMYGHDREAALALDPRELVYAPHRHGYEAFVQRVRAGEAFHMEAVNQRGDGTVFNVEVSGVPMEYHGRRHMLAFARDITERKERLEALRASEEQYRAIFNASADGMILFDASGRIVDVNQATLKLFGYSREEFLVLDAMRRFHPDAHPVLQQFHKRLRSGWFFEETRFGVTMVEETREITRDGRVLEFEAHLVSMYYRGRPHVLAIKRDITERKQREAALRKSEDRLRTTVEASLDCIISMDADGRVIEFNPAAEACFGFARDEVIGNRLADLIIPAAQRAAHEAGMSRYRETGRGDFLGRRVTVQALRADGSEFPAELAIAAARAPEGDIFIGYLRDLSEQRAAEEERARLGQQLRQAQKMEAIGHLTGGIAHDFNNILTSILGYTMMASERCAADDDPVLAKYLDQIRTSGERARDLIRQMLTFSRGRRGEPRVVGLSRLVEESINLFRSTFPSSIVFNIRAAVTVPPVMVDPVQFEQVLMNLCINARDAMRGVGEIHIGLADRIHVADVCASCGSPVDGGFVELVVSDNGTGISSEVMESMFEPFFTTKEVGQGSGMGLPTTHGIVHEYGGHILVDNPDTGGARFRVLFPPAGARQGEDPEGVDTTEAAPDGLGGRVMVVDDEGTVREFLREFLESRGLEVRVAADGAEALHALSDDETACDLLITDQTMPRITGVELAYRLKAIRPVLPIVLISGYSDVIGAATAGELGVDAVLAKPVDYAELLNTVRDLLGRER